MLGGRPWIWLASAATVKVLLNWCAPRVARCTVHSRRLGTWSLGVNVHGHGPFTGEGLRMRHPRSQPARQGPMRQQGLASTPASSALFARCAALPPFPPSFARPTGSHSHCQLLSTAAMAFCRSHTVQRCADALQALQVQCAVRRQAPLRVSNALGLGAVVHPQPCPSSGSVVRSLALGRVCCTRRLPDQTRPDRARASMPPGLRDARARAPLRLARNLASSTVFLED